MKIVRGLLAIFLWLLDLMLKFVIGAALVRLLWCCTAYPFGFTFGVGWSIASALTGLAIVGFFDGDDIILNGFAKRLKERTEKRTNKEMHGSCGSRVS